MSTWHHPALRHEGAHDGSGGELENGDVQAANGAVKRALSQALLMRGSSRDFASRAALQSFADDGMRKSNRSRGRRGADEIGTMREFNVDTHPPSSSRMTSG